MQRQNYQDDEINLADYIKVIIKQKVLIGVIFITCVAGTAIASFLMPEVYQIDSTVRIGKIGDSLPLPAEIIAKLKSKSLPRSIIQGTNENISIEELQKAIKIDNIKDTNFLKIRMESTDPDTAIDILNKIENKFISDSNVYYEKSVALIEERVRELHLRKEDIVKQVKMLNQRIADNKMNSDYLLMENALANYENIYNELSTIEYSLKQDLLSAKNFEIIDPPANSTKPIKPKKKQMIAISAVLGAMLGIFVAFFVEFWQNSGVRINE